MGKNTDGAPASGNCQPIPPAIAVGDGDPRLSILRSAGAHRWNACAELPAVRKAAHADSRTARGNLVKGLARSNPLGKALRANQEHQHMATEVKAIYTVHSVNRQLVPVGAMINDKPASALVDGFAVQLVPKDAQHGSITMNFFGDELAAAQEIFKADAVVELTVKA
jgi:hypothetical protein